MYLDILQKINNTLYKILGTSDIVIGVQLYINQKRHDDNKIDKKEILLYDNERPIVQ